MEHLDKIEIAAKDLIKYYIPEYYFVWDSSKRRKGECRRNVKQIGLSKPIAILNTFECMLLTVIHEIAHALTPKGHGPEWKRVCLELGGDGQRTYNNSETVTPDKTYVGMCLNCHKTVKRFRLSKRPMACSSCCIKFNSGKFTEKYLFKWQ